MLRFCTLIFQYDIHTNALKSQYYYPDLIELQNAPLTYLFSLLKSLDGFELWKIMTCDCNHNVSKSSGNLEFRAITLNFAKDNNSKIPIIFII